MHLVSLEPRNNLVKEGGHFAEEAGERGTRVKAQGNNNLLNKANKQLRQEPPS